MRYITAAIRLNTAKVERPVTTIAKHEAEIGEEALGLGQRPVAILNIGWPERRDAHISSPLLPLSGQERTRPCRMVTSY